MASLNLQEKANFTRLSRLLVDKGCEALQMTFDAIHPPANLTTVLNANKSVLLKLKPRVINLNQWYLLFPPSGNPPADSKTFDITLLTVLLRNICGLHPPETGWNTMPPNTDNSPAANITRIKLLRNEVYGHVSSTQIDNATFENLWQKVTKALVNLKIPLKEIDDLKTCPLSPEEEMYEQELKDWYLKDKDYRSALDCLDSNVKLLQRQYSESVSLQQVRHKEVASTLQHVTEVAKENRQQIQRLSHVKTWKSRRSSMEAQLLQSLAKHNFKSKILCKVELFHPGTREWLLKKVESWFTAEDRSRILLIKAGPGFGKSVFAAKVCKIFQKKKKFAACHFCDYSDSNLKDPMMMLQSLASQMTENIPGFKEKLVDQLLRPHNVNSLKDAFQIYLQNPLDEINVEPRLIMIDGLDESTTADKKEMIKLIRDHFSDLPKSVKVLITSRPEILINTLERIQIIETGCENEECDLDLLKYLEDTLPHLAVRNVQNAQTEHNVIQDDGVLSRIVKKCQGCFLYAFHVQNELHKRQDLGSISTEEVMLWLPNGIKSIYEEYFRRLDNELESILKRKPDLCQLLKLLVATTTCLPLRFVARVLGLDIDCRETVKIISEINDAVSCVFHVSNEEVTFYDKTVYDWLLLKGENIHQYSVTVDEGESGLWLVCKQIYEKIKSDVIKGRELKLTNDVVHALKYGLKYLLACKMKESFHWFVDMIIVHAFLTFYPKEVSNLYLMWASALACDNDLNFKLRQRISWFITEIRSREMETTIPTSYYFELVLNYSPLSCFTDYERETAKILWGKCNRYVKRYSAGNKILKLFLAKDLRRPIRTIGLSSSKKLAAIALQDGTIYIVSLPKLVEIFRHTTEDLNIPCCTFTPDDAVVLYGKLEMGLSVSKRKEISFFSGNEESFKSCAFSTGGKRLVTNDGSSEVKLWDVSRRSQLLCLDAGVSLSLCSFSKTGLFIIGDFKDSKEDSYCVWNAITFQRADLRSLSRRKNKTKDVLQRSEKCNRCFIKAHKELTPLKLLGSSTGIYNGVESILYFGEHQFFLVIESTHYTTLAAWGLFIRNFSQESCSAMTMINDNHLLVSQDSNLNVFFSEEPKETQKCLSLPTVVVWCSFSPDGTRIATYTSDGFINLWNVDSCQVYERFRSSTDILSGACWWSTGSLFVCHLQDGFPNLSKYPVDENFGIKITQNISVPLLPIISDLLPLSEIQEFSEGYISFACHKIGPVKIVNVNKMEYPAMVSLPEITSTMSIVVSPGASLILGSDVKAKDVIVWKRIQDDPLSYLVHWKFWGMVFSSQWCFSNDLKFVFSYIPPTHHYLLGDLVNKVRQDGVVQGGYIPNEYRVPVKVFFTKEGLVIVTSRRINIIDLNEYKCLSTISPRNLTAKSVLNSKLSPDGNVLAVPTVTGDMDFFQILHSGSS